MSSTRVAWSPSMGDMQRSIPRARTCPTPHQRLRAVYNAFSAAGLQLEAAPLLLVDDRTDSGWTFCEAARVLREAGAGPVLPFALALDA